MTAIYDCCGHCRHDINDPPHDRPCPEDGCEEARERAARELQEAMEWVDATWPAAPEAAP